MTFADAVAKAVLDVSKEWSAIKKKQERDRRQADRLEERYRTGRSTRVTVKEAAYAAIPEAYLKASGGGKYPANARQIMYSARPEIQSVTGLALDDRYFTQHLLPDYIRDNPERTAEWDVVYDARGHLSEPHTGYEIGLGTLGVREYLAVIGESQPRAALGLPELPTLFRTRGPMNRYGAILYIEKEGFLPLLQQARFAERYDLAIMSSKGMGTTAVRTLIERLSGDVTVLALHDFDKSGFSIVGTLTRDTRRYTYTTAPRVVDLGLRLHDVEQWSLQAEDVVHPSDPTGNLADNGATAEEIEFLRGEQGYHHGSSYKGRRVELNAFASNDFVHWLESKLKAHQILKVIPDEGTLIDAYRRAAGIRKYRAILEGALQAVEEYASRIEPPVALRDRIAEQLARTPSLSWDEAIQFLLPLDISA